MKQEQLLLGGMGVTRSLTEFEQKCEVELCSALSARRMALTNGALAGESETYISASSVLVGRAAEFVR